jgi:hypothetical protein
MQDHQASMAVMTTELTGYSLTFCGYGCIRGCIGGNERACGAPQQYRPCCSPTAALLLQLCVAPHASQHGIPGIPHLSGASH